MRFKTKPRKLLTKMGIASVCFFVLCYIGLRFGNWRRQRTAPVATAIAESEIEIFAYNTHLLPTMAAMVAGDRSDSEYRAREIAKQVTQYDIVGLSEVFDESLAAKLIDAVNLDADQPYAFVRSPQPSGVFQFASGGLVLFSRFPIVQQHSREYSVGSRFISTRFAAADGLSAKGVLHARIKLSESKQLDCFLTHLESYSANIRDVQVQELAAFIKQDARSDHPFVVIGDFNIRGECRNESSGAEYKNLLEQLSLPTHTTRDLALTQPAHQLPGTTQPTVADGGSRIDYVFFAEPKSTTPLTVDYETMPLLDATVSEGSLSDHSATWAKIHL